MKQLINEKRILITGSNGCLGSNLVCYFFAKGYEVYGTDLHDLSANPDIAYFRGDLTDRDFVEFLFNEVKPGAVINTVALVSLDHCEEDKDLAYRMNVLTADNVAKAAKSFGARMLHISTDHFFRGEKSFYMEKDVPEPVNHYGLTKLQAEKVCLAAHPDLVVIRTNFYGWSPAGHHPTFAEWLYQTLLDETPINLYIDYYFTPIEATAFAEALEAMANSDFVGVINIAGTERCSKYEFGMAMAEVFGVRTNAITAARIDAASFKVKRQPDLSLSTQKFKEIIGMSLPDIKAGLERFKKTMPKEVSVNNENK